MQMAGELAVVKPQLGLLPLTFAVLQVIEKFLKKAKVSVKILPLFSSGEWPSEVKLVGEDCPESILESPQPNAFLVEKLKHGYIMLPDVSKFGPMYFCKMQRMAD